MSEHGAGRELDALVAERVMGYVVAVRRYVWAECGEWDRSDYADEKDAPCIPVDNVKGWLPRYSTDTAAAWEVVEKLSPGRLLGLSEFLRRRRPGAAGVARDLLLHRKQDAATREGRSGNPGACYLPRRISCPPHAKRNEGDGTMKAILAWLIAVTAALVWMGSETPADDDDLAMRFRTSGLL